MYDLRHPSWYDANDEERVEAAAKMLLNFSNPPEVVICFSDWIAYGVLRCLRARGKSFGLVGMLGLDLAAREEISTLAVSSDRLGRQGFALLKEMAEHAAPGRIERISLSLVERETFRFPA